MKPAANEPAIPTMTGRPSPADPTPPGDRDARCAPVKHAALAARAIAPAQLRDRTRYQVLGEHGRGGLGRVTRAHDLELRRDVAIKELLSRDDIREARFVREAMITARLEHPGIVPIHEAGRWSDGTAFYAMKLVSGRPLRDLIAERTTVDQRIGLLHHVIAVADAIAYAHGRNIIHRDLKPANIIVGDFGETVVIDWGLAKDLTVGDDLPAGSDDSPHHSRDTELTAAGTVLGTATYMAPEQARGEHVDQRADVYAIGAMLWELCSLHRVPPDDRRQRHRMLRRAGIDTDLITILDKALARDAARRYRDAGVLAADLKAFKAGARIAARDYSLFATLAHWTRRHRALAISATTTIALAITGTAVYVRTTAAERDRADNSEHVARRAQATAEAALDEITLKHAQVLLTTDPTAALDALATYRGSDLSRADQIRAEAVSRGVAFLRATPHTSNVIWAQGMADGTIVSAGLDGTIARTARDGSTTVLATGLASAGRSAYAPAHRLLAYVCEPSALCLFDLLHSKQVLLSPALRQANVTGLSFSPSGALLATMSRDAVLQVLDVTDPERPRLRLRKAIARGTDVRFLEEDTVVASTEIGIEFVRMNGDSQPLPVPDASHWDPIASERKFVLAATGGHALIIEPFSRRNIRRRELCHGDITRLQFVPIRSAVVYACRQGVVGIWDLERDETTPLTQLEGYASSLAMSPTGEYLLAGGGNGSVTVVDLQTGLVASYQGHGFRLTSLTAPSVVSPFVISGDASGALRAWPLPPRNARVLATANTHLHTAMLDEHSDTVIATTWLPALTTFSPSAGVRSTGPHEPSSMFLVPSSHGRVFAAYGLNDVVELWSSATMTRQQLINTDQGSVSQLEFVEGSDDFITAGRDGQLVRWTTAGKPTRLVRVDQPIEAFAQVTASSIVFSTLDGTLWRSDIASQPIALRRGRARVGRIVLLPDRRTLLAGDAGGDVIAIDTRSWQQALILRATGAIRSIAPTSDGTRVAVATSSGTIHVSEAGSLGASWPWRTLTARVRHVAWAHNDLLVASCTDGIVWVYSAPHQRLFSLPFGTANLGRITVNVAGSAAIVLDTDGRVISIDLDVVRRSIDADSPDELRRGR